MWYTNVNMPLSPLKLAHIPLKRKTGSLSRPKIKRAPRGKIKPRGISKLKKELDAVFSKYIRAIYPEKCYTCGKVSQRKNLQCGHFVPRIYLSTRWDERNCRPQCMGCNIYGRGQLLDFEENLTKELGIEVVKELKEKRNEVWKLKSDFYRESIEYYQQLLITL